MRPEADEISFNLCKRTTQRIKYLIDVNPISNRSIKKSDANWQMSNENCDIRRLKRIYLLKIIGYGPALRKR